MNVPITHNLNTIKNCDKILILDKGKIVDSGTHDKLLKNSEIYSNLFEKFTKPSVIVNYHKANALHVYSLCKNIKSF